MARTSTRRQFIQQSGAALAGASLLSQSKIRAKTADAGGANERVRVGLIGAGSRGPYVGYVMHLAEGAELVACCDVDQTNLSKAVRMAEGFLGKPPKTYHDYRKLLDDRDIDAVIIATPSHWHVLPAIDACQAGKDVYLEKPVGTSVSEGRALIKAASQTGQLVQMGTQQHSWEHYQEAVQLIQDGLLGEISLVHVWDVGNAYPGFGSPADGAPPDGLDWDFWLGPAPKVAYNPNRFAHHYWFFDYGGAWQVAWGAHHYDIVHWAMKVRGPTSATGAGSQHAFLEDNRQWPDTFSGTCTYGPGPVARKGFLMQYTCRAGCAEPIEGRWHGKAFYGTDGTLIIDRSGFEIRPQVRDDKKVIAERTVKSARSEHEVVQAHTSNFIECVRQRRQPAANIEVGHLATNPGHLMNIAWRTGRRIEWSVDREEITNFPEANRWLTKSYHNNWALPT